MKCPVCGTENEAGAVFCYQCGSALGTAPERSATGSTVDLSRGSSPTLDRTPEPDERSFVPNTPAQPLGPAGGARVYRVPSSAGPSYSGMPVTTMPRTSSMAIVALTLGVISFLGLFFIAGVGAIITGHLARREIRASGGQVTGEGMATVGLVLGYINVVLSVLGLIAICLLPVLFGLGASVAP